jgi:hypothetical protein
LYFLWNFLYLFFFRLHFIFQSSLCKFTADVLQVVCLLLICWISFFLSFLFGVYTYVSFFWSSL